MVSMLTPLVFTLNVDSNMGTRLRPMERFQEGLSRVQSATENLRMAVLVCIQRATIGHPTK